MGLAPREKSAEKAGDMEIDLKPFINFLVVLIPVLMLSAEFAKISVINMKLPEGRGSQTADAQTQRPIDDESDKLMLTMIITDSVVTIGAKNGFLPSLFYKEFHHYVSSDDRRVEETAEFDPRNPSKKVMNPKSGKPFKISERQDILLYVTDETYKEVQQCLYTKDGFMLADERSNPLTTVKVGDTAWLVRNPRSQVIIQDPTIYKLLPLMAYDQMRNRLMVIKERYRNARDAEDIIIAAENQVAYDKIVQLMDVARSADFPNISIAKLRG
jgi:biopolymer transport protein ExbD